MIELTLSLWHYYRSLCRQARTNPAAGQPNGYQSSRAISHHARPQLNLAQPFIEDIAKHLVKHPNWLETVQRFALKSAMRKSSARQDFYLLAITQRNACCIPSRDFCRQGTQSQVAELLEFRR